VLQVFHRVHRELPETRLLMVGDGPDRGLAEQYCRDHGFCGAVTFIGNLPLVEEVLIGADLFLFASESESFGVAVLEAMAAGVAVVATAAGGIPEVVADGETGLLRPVGDVEGLAAAAAGLLADDEGRRRMGDAARRRAGTVFSEAEMVGRYRALYERVVDAAARPAVAATAVG
jgi:glycosyltransferase involved in cell wall biosynthesis